MHRGIALICCLGLSACVTQEYFVKQNVTYDQYERDFVGCATKASQDVPTNTQVGWAPYVGIYSQDTNAALRQKNFGLCMRDMGYQSVPLNFCSGDAATQARKAASLRQNRENRMKITSQTCYVTKADGSPFLYTPT